jgi:tetratricopeptide (TPR) repeat protein
MKISTIFSLRLSPGVLGLTFLVAAPCLPAQDFNHEVKPGTQGAAREEANAALEARDYARALKVLAPLAEANPKDSRLLYDLGSAKDALDQESGAEESYRAAIADDPNFLAPRVAVGLLLARNARMEDARKELAAAAALTSGDAALRARALRALARIDQKSRPGDARNELLEALKISPETPEDTLLSAELAQSATGGAGAAEAAYRRVLLAHPNDAEATTGLARLLVQQKHPAEAELYLTKALAAHAGDPGLTVQLASTYAAEGKAATSVPLIEGLAQAHPGDANINRLLAGLYIDSEQWAEAETLLATLTAQNPQDTRSIDDRGRALVHLRRYAEAQDILTRIVAQPKLFPSPEALGDAAGHLAFAASQNNDPEAALRAISVRATVLPASPPLLFVAAISHDKLHHVKLAEQTYKQFLEASNGANPDEEFEARHRLVALAPMK